MHIPADNGNLFSVCHFLQIITAIKLNY